MKAQSLGAIVACALLTGFAVVFFGRPLIAKLKNPSHGDSEEPTFRIVGAECDSTHGVRITVANALLKPLPENFQLTVKAYAKNDAFIVDRSNGIARRGIPVAPTAPVLWPGEEFPFRWPLAMLSDSAGNPPAYIQVSILPLVVVKGAGMASVALDRNHPAKLIGDSKIACVAPAATSAPLAARKKSAFPATMARTGPNLHPSLTLSKIALQNTTRYGIPLSAPASTFDVFKLFFVNWEVNFRNSSPADSNIKRYRLHATFYAPGGHILGSVDDFETVSADQRTVTFSGRVGNSGDAFQLGTYTIRFYLDGREFAERQFTVVEAEKRGSAAARQIQQETQRRAQQLDLPEERKQAEELWAKRLKECWAGVAKWTSEIAEAENRPAHDVYNVEQKTERIDNLRRAREEERSTCKQMEKSAN